MKLGLFAIGFIAIPSLARLQLIPESFTSNEKWSVPNLHTCVPRRYSKSPNDQNSSFFQVLQFESPILVFEGLKGTSAKLFALITFPLYTF